MTRTSWLVLLVLAPLLALAGVSFAQTSPPPGSYTLALDPAYAENFDGQEHCVTATLSAPGSTASVEGVPILFFVDGSAPYDFADAKASVETDAQGEAELCYHGPEGGGASRTDIIDVFADPNENGMADLGEPSAQAQKLYVQGATLALAPQSAENIAGQEHCVTATLSGSAGTNPSLAGIPILFFVDDPQPLDAANANDTVETDAQGEAEFCYRGPEGGSADPTDVIFAVADTNENEEVESAEPTVLAQKTYVEGTLTLDPATAENIEGQEHCVTATLAAPTGSSASVEGVPILFFVDDPQPLDAANANDTVETDAQGEAEFCYRGPEGGSADPTDVIFAVADTNENEEVESAEPTVLAQKTYVEGTLTLDPATAENIEGQEHCVTATLAAPTGSSASVEGVPILFFVDDPQPLDAANANDTVETDAQGEAEFCYRGPEGGSADPTDVIFAVADTNENEEVESAEPTVLAQKTYVEGTLTLDPATAENIEGQEHCVTATLAAPTGSSASVEGVPILFFVDDPQPLDAANANDTVETDAQGEAEFCYRGPEGGLENGTSGGDLIQAVADTNENRTPDQAEPTAHAQKTYVEGTLTLDPATAENIEGQEHCVTATLSAPTGASPPLGGIPILFFVDGPFVRASVTTDAEGEAEFCYRGPEGGLENGTSGGDLIQAVADTNENRTPDQAEPTAHAQKTYVEGTLTLDPATAENIEGQEHCVTATLSAPTGASPPLGGIPILFFVDGPFVRASVTTDAEGEAEFCYRGPEGGLENGTSGSDLIQAVADINENDTGEVDEPTAFAQKTYVEGTLTLDPATAENIEGQEHCVTATLSAPTGSSASVEGVPILFFVDDRPPLDAANANDMVETDAQGEAAFCYRGPVDEPANTAEDIDAIQAVADINENDTGEVDEPTAFAQKTYVEGTLTLDPATAENIEGQEHCVTATLSAPTGSSASVEGVPVLFFVDDRPPLDAANANDTATTDAQGEAEFCYRGPVGDDGPGDFIQAFADTNENGTVDQAEPGRGAAKRYVEGTLTLDPATAENIEGQEHCVTATLSAAGGMAPVEGFEVVFSVSGANTAGGADTTDARGEAGFCYTGTELGRDQIRAYADTNDDGAQDSNEPTAAAQKDWVAGPPATVDLTPEASSTPVGTQRCLTATVVDRFGNPTFAIVDFAATGSAQPAAGSAITDAQGRAQFCFTSPLPGEVTVTATVRGTSTTDQARASFVASTSDCGEVEADGSLSTNRRASFDVDVENEGGTHGPRGSVTFRDSAAGRSFVATKILSLAISGTQATISGRGMSNGNNVQFRVVVREARTSSFEITLSNGYSAAGQVKNGDVEVDREDCEDDDGDDD